MVAGWDEDAVDGQRDGIGWDLYPRVNAAPHARAFVLRLHALSRRPKTVDAYARNLERFLGWFSDVPTERWVEADEGDLLAYLDDLRHGRVAGIGAGLKHAPPENVLPLSGSRLAEATVAQHVVTLRQFFDQLIRAHLRSDPINPVIRGGSRWTGDAKQHGFVQKRGRLPWVAPADVWERIVLHVVKRVLDYYLDHERRALVDALALDERGPLFISESTRNPGRPLKPGAFNDVVDALRTTLELPHTFRYQRLTALKAAGVPLEDNRLVCRTRLNRNHPAVSAPGTGRARG